MADTALVILPIPHGTSDAGDLVVSLVISPRLFGDTSLHRFPDLLEWTARLTEPAPRVTLRFGAMLVEGVARTAPLRPALWDALFDEDTPVVPFKFDDYTDRLVVSYPTREAARAIEERYATLSVEHPASPPTALETTRVLRELAVPELAEPDWLDRQRQVRRDTQDARRTRPPTVEETARAFAVFHRMPQPSKDAGNVLPKREELASLLDFHRVVSALGNYPALQRATGLVIDVVVRAEDVPATPAGLPAAEVSVADFAVGDGWSGAVRLLTPAVLYRHRPAAQGTPALFFAADPPGAISDTVEGFLELDEARFHLLDLDVDGALVRLTSLASMLPRAPPWVDGALPALRSAGLALAVNNRGADLVRGLGRSKEIDAALTSGQGKALGASDLVRGYRLDVWSGHTNRWYSLHEREATFLFGDDGELAFNVTEEGFAQLATASPARDPTRSPAATAVEKDLYLHERLARWTGWSLSAPRPGRPFNRSPDPAEATNPDPTVDEIVTPFPMRTRFQPVPRSLPRLRYGSSYRVRARTVDFAGNSPLPTPLEAGPKSVQKFAVSLPLAPSSVPYLRYEPVPPPIVVLRSQPDDRAAALMRIVIRSFNASEPLDTAATEEVDERHIAPPSTSVEIAERHGALDSGDHSLADPATFAMLVQRHDAALPTVTAGDPPKDVPIVSVASMTVDYLPDPIARGAALRFLPGIPSGRVSDAGDEISHADDPTGNAGPVLRVPFGTSWPERQTFRIQLVEGDGAPVWNAAERILTISLPKAGTRDVSMSSFVSGDDLSSLGLWAWQRRRLERLAQEAIDLSGDGLADSLEEHARTSARLARLALEGAQWALTPAATLSLVHAVQQPLGKPEFCCLPGASQVTRMGGRYQPSRLADPRTTLAAWRELNSRDALLVGALEIHYPSTGRLDIACTLLDVVDDARDETDGSERREIKLSGTVEPIRLPESAPAEIAAQGLEPRLVALHDVPGRRLLFLPRRPTVDGSSSAAAPIHRIDSTRHVVATYHAIATSRFESEFPTGLRLSFTREGSGITIDVPSSSPPIAPSIVGMVPTFGWRRESAGTLATSLRESQSVRIFLARPWHSSGDGELLGVVVWPEGHAGPSDLDRRDKFKNFVTQWGLDPVRRSGHLAPMPTLSAFPGAVATASGVAIAARPEISYDVAGHTVGFDRERNVWFADVTLAADTAYMPFIRLALVRFQPHAIPGAEISPVVLADFVQLAPDRSAVLIADADAGTLYRLIVSGVASQPSTLAPWRSQIEITVQERELGLDDELAWHDAPVSMAKITPIDPPPNAPAVLFSGYVELAARARPGRLRILVREYETWSTAPLEQEKTTEPPSPPSEGATLYPAAQSGQMRAAAQVGTSQGPSLARDAPATLTGRAIERLAKAGSGPNIGRRLVYAEAIPLEPVAVTADNRDREVMLALTEIQKKYRALKYGGILDLGDTTGPEEQLSDGGCKQYYELGAIYYHPRVGSAFECHGLIHKAYVELGEHLSGLGYPTADEADDPAAPLRRISKFECGSLTFDPATGVIPFFDETESTISQVVVKIVDALPLGIEQGMALNLDQLATAVGLVTDDVLVEAVRLILPDVEFRLMFDALSQSRILELVAEAQSMSPEYEPPHFDNYLLIDCPGGIDTEAVAVALSQWEGIVELAYTPAALSDPKVVAIDNPHFVGQGYLAAAPLGIGVKVAWAEGADGSGTRFIDLERGWLLNHEDLPRPIDLLAGANINISDAFAHGAAVLGVIVAVDDNKGIVGIAPRATASVMSRLELEPAGPVTGLPLVANRLLLANDFLRAGDVMQIEVQMLGEAEGIDVDILAPVELDEAVFRAIELLTSRGVIVVAVAANGGVNLDHLVDEFGRRVLDVASPDFRDSGAIMVGGCTSEMVVPGVHEILYNHGSRIDCWAWGDNVVTCGDRDNSRNPIGYLVFDGTSAAAPIITGVCLLIQNLQFLLQPKPGQTGRLRSRRMREILRNPANGTPVSGSDHPMPDMAKIIANEYVL